MISRQMKAKESDVQKPESHTNLCFLNYPQRKERFIRLHTKDKVCHQRLSRLREKIERMLQERGVQVTAELHEDLVATMHDHMSELKKKYPPGSFGRIFLGTAATSFVSQGFQAHEMATSYDQV